MPQLEDAPTQQIAKLVGTTDLTVSDSTLEGEVAQGDLIQIYKVSTGEAVTVTVAELMKAMGLTPA